MSQAFVAAVQVAGRPGVAAWRAQPQAVIEAIVLIEQDAGDLLG